MLPLIKKSARIMFGVLVPVILVSIILGDWILRIIGSEYASHGTAVLRLLLLGCLAVAANSMSAYVLKLANRMSRWIVANAVGCVVILGFARPSSPGDWTGWPTPGSWAMRPPRSWAWPRSCSGETANSPGDDRELTG